MIKATRNPIVLRTDFSDASAWMRIERAIAEAPVERIDDPIYAGTLEENLRDLLTEPRFSFLFVVDAKTISGAEHPILVVDLSEEEEPSFRALPAAIEAIAKDLSSGAQDFADFAEEADLRDDGIFRGV